MNIYGKGEDVRVLTALGCIGYIWDSINKNYIGVLIYVIWKTQHKTFIWLKLNKSLEVIKICTI